MKKLDLYKQISNKPVLLEKSKTKMSFSEISFLTDCLIALSKKLESSLSETVSLLRQLDYFNPLYLYISEHKDYSNTKISNWLFKQISVIMNS